MINMMGKMAWKRLLKIGLMFVVAQFSIFLFYTKRNPENADLVSDTLMKRNMPRDISKADSIERHLTEKQDVVHFSFVVCNRRFKQSVVMMKSVILFLKSKIVFHILADKSMMKRLHLQLDLWPPEYMKRVSYHIYDIHFPDSESRNSSKWKDIFQPCATERLFLPTLLPNVDAVIYTDIDVVFLSPVDDLWSMFSKFNSTQLAAVAKEKERPLLRDYAYRDPGEYYLRKIPHFGVTGLNSGVMLMNLTRMRASVWNSEIIRFQQLYEDDLPLGDQDIVNIYFHFYPHQLLLLSCMWNYRTIHCRKDELQRDCKDAVENGVRLIHGNKYLLLQAANETRRDKDPILKVIFNAFGQHDLRFNTVPELLESIKREIDNTEETEWQCKRLKHCFINYLQTYVNSFIKQGVT